MFCSELVHHSIQGSEHPFVTLKNIWKFTPPTLDLHILSDNEGILT